MKKFKGLINRMVAMSLSGMLIIGSASGSVFASSTDADPARHLRLRLRILLLKKM